MREPAMKIGELAGKARVQGLRFSRRLVVGITAIILALLATSTPASAFLNPQNTAPTMVRQNIGITIGYNTWTVLSGCQNKKLEVKAYLRSGRVDRTGVHVKNIDFTYYGNRGGYWGRVLLWPGNGAGPIEISTWGPIPPRTYTHTVQVNRWVPAGSTPIHLTQNLDIANFDACGGRAHAAFHFRPYP